VNMLWCQGDRAQNTGLFNRKLKSRTLWSQCTPVPDRQSDEQTDRRTNIIAMARDSF